MFVIGCPNLMISVDHKPLVPIFSDRALEKISNPRLFSFKERSLMYCFTMKHTPGKAHTGPDATSHYPVASSIHALLHSCNPTAQPAPNDINESIKLSRIASLHTDQYFPTAKKVCNNLPSWFCIYGAPQEQASDGGPPFQSHEYQQFFKDWGIKQCLSSAYYPQSNGRAELAVKTAKRILLDNTNSAGQLQNDQTACAFMMHRNTPIQDVGISPAMMLFGRPIKDHLSTIRDHLSVRPQWKEIRELREKAMAKRHICDMESYNANTRTLPPLLVGDSVSIQNQIGNHPNRWEKTGTITETLDNRQYRVKVDGSNRVNLHNRRFLRKIAPVGTPRCPILDLPYIDPKTTSTPLDATAPSRQDSPTLEEPKRPPLTQTAPCPLHPSMIRENSNPCLSNLS